MKSAARHRRRPAPLIGVTVRTPAYAALSREAVARFKRFTGLPVQVIDCADAEAFWTKINLPLLLPRTRCVFFDADWWALRTLDFSGWQGGSMLAVHDAGVFHPAAFCKPDCEALRLEKALYFNTGFFAWDNADARHRLAFTLARRFWRTEQVQDFGEQSLLNAGVQRAGVPVSLLPFGWNCMLHFVRGGVYPYIPRVVHAVHAAGVPLRRKMTHLRAAAQILSYAPEPLQAEAVTFHHQLTFDTR